ncbi:paraquat-inducible protein A, partial [Pseudomonas aeruginosa]
MDDDKPSPSRQRSWLTKMRAIDAGILVGGECHQVNRAHEHEHPHCSRCGAELHARRPNSLTRTWAL